MIIRLILIALVLIPSLAHAFRENEPAGFTTILNCSLSGALCSGMYNVYNTLPFASPGGSNQQSPPQVLDQFKPSGSGVGNGEWGINFAPSREVFFEISMRTTSYGITNNNNKIIFMKNPSNSFLVWQGSYGSGGKRLKWYQQERVNNEHVSGAAGMNYPIDGTGWFEPNVNGAACDLTPNNTQFMDIQIYLKGSSTNTSKDGIIKIWCNNVLSSHFTNVNQGTDLSNFPGTFSNSAFTATWDGTADKVDSRDHHHYLDHWYISAGTSSGGGPVDNPPGAPGTVTGVTATVSGVQ